MASPDKLYVTFVEVDIEFLKVWGQKDRVVATFIEKQLLQLIPINRTQSPNPAQIRKGTFCYAKYVDDNYYRARVISDVQGDSVTVLFVDYGNKDIINISNIKMEKEGNVLEKIAEQAEEYYVANVGAPAGGWTGEIISQIREDICNEEFPIRLVYQTGNFKFIEIQFHNENFSNFLVRKKIARHVSLPIQNQMIMTYYSQVPTNPKINLSRVNPSLSFGGITSSNISNLPLKPTNEINQQYNYSLRHNPKPPPEEGILRGYFWNKQFLEVGGTFNVFISHEDGPWSFSVQLASSENELNKLIDEISVTKIVPLKPPIISGLPCIAASMEYGGLWRGIIENVSYNSVKVYFVDYGNTEDLPVSSLYEIPDNFFKTKVLSQKFSLAGSNNIPYSEKIKRQFKEVVQDKLLMLQVTSIEGGHFPSCELYLNNTNIKRFFNEETNEVRYNCPKVYPKVNETVDVVMTWIESPQKFFVQNKNFAAELLVIENHAAEVFTCNQKLTFNELSIGLKCVCVSQTNKAKSYRTGITSINSEHAITVVYFDYGIKETVDISQLRKIPDDFKFINYLNVQAIPCSLYGFEVKPFDELANEFLRSITNTNDLQMTVVSYANNFLSVRLFAEGIDVGQLMLKPDFREKFSSMKKNSEKKNEWKEPYLAGSASPGKFFHNSHRIEKRDDGKSHGDKNRSEDKVNWRDGKRRDIHYSDKFNGGRGFKQDIENNWRNPKPLMDDKFSVKKEKKGRLHLHSEKFSRNREKDNQNYIDRKSSKFNDKKEFEPNKEGKAKHGDSKLFHSQGVQGKKPEKNRGLDFSLGNGNFDAKEKISEAPKSKKGKYGKSFVKKDKPEKKSDTAKSKKQPIRKEDVTPSGTKFQERVIEIGSCEKGIVTYYKNPHEFYIQLLTQEEDFKKMMFEIQQFYDDKYSERNPIQEGSVVAAKFSMDNVLYRGEIIKSSPLTVRFIDYGNEETTEPKKIWLLGKQFLELPKQAVKCRLSNISSLGPAWPFPGSELDRFFEFQKYICTFLNFDNGVYEISLKNLENGKDIVEEIISIGHGKRPKIEIPDVEFSLLPNQNLKLYISHVENTSKFYIVINPSAAELLSKEIKAYTDCKENLKPFESSYLKPDTLCLMKMDEQWYRGTIVKIEQEKITVWCNDVGVETEATADKLMVLPELLRDIHSQAVECSLHGFIESLSPSREKEFKTKMEKSNCIVSIKSVTGKRLSVILYDLNGQVSEFQNDLVNILQNVEPITHLPLYSQKLPVVVASLKSPEEVHIRAPSDSNLLENLTKQLNDFYEPHSEGFDVKNDENMKTLVAAKSIELNCWCRGRIVSTSWDLLEISYIDFGKTENLPRKNVKRLDAKFFELNALAKKVSLNLNYDHRTTEEINKKILELIEGEKLVGIFTNENNEFFIDFILKGSRMTAILAALFSTVVIDDKNLPGEIYSTSEQKSDDSVEIDTSDFKISKNLKVMVSYIDSLNQFWVHKESSVEDLQRFQEKIQSCCEISSEKQNVQKEDVVGVVFDGSWFRAKVLSVEDNRLSVQFVDYGNFLVVDYDEVRELTSDLIEVPIFATRCSLKGTWTEDSTSKFKSLLSYEDPLDLEVLEESDPIIVDLFIDGKSVTENFLTEDEYETNESNLCFVYLTHSNSPDDFYIQRETCTESLNAIACKLLDANTFDDAPSLFENELYAAKFPEDDTWYRARLIEKHSEGGKVYFVDFGNASNVTEIKCLPADLVRIPALAENCCLVYGNGNDVWSEIACEKFSEHTDRAPLRMEVIANKMKKMFVKLYTEEGCINEKLEKLCEGDGRSDAYITHVDSPVEFYIRYVDDKEYDVIESNLEKGNEYNNLEDKKVGSLCAAYFVDEGLWLRGKIVQNLDEEWRVFSIDTGNIFVSDQLKKLPVEMEEISPRALKCSLDLPVKNVPESIKEEFISLTSSRNSIFQARVITSGDVNVISLKRDGIILEKILSLDTNSEEVSNFENTLDSRVSNSLDDKTDDDKHSKKNIVTEVSFLSSNLEDDFRHPNSIRNETDEEKRVKISAINAVDGGSSEGFKSDDEKGISESVILSNLVNATDNQLMEESQETEEDAGTMEREESLVSADNQPSTDSICVDENIKRESPPFQETSITEVNNREEKTESGESNLEVKNDGKNEEEKYVEKQDTVETKSESVLLENSQENKNDNSSSTEVSDGKTSGP